MDDSITLLSKVVKITSRYDKRMALIFLEHLQNNTSKTKTKRNILKSPVLKS